MSCPSSARYFLRTEYTCIGTYVRSNQAEKISRVKNEYVGIFLGVVGAVRRVGAVFFFMFRTDEPKTNVLKNLIFIMTTLF